MVSEEEYDSEEVDEIVLANGVRVPAVAGRYRVTPPPDLNETENDMFFLEYDYPELIVREVALRLLPNLERQHAEFQLINWISSHRNTGGIASSDRCGYQFNWSSSSSGYLQQLIPDMSYIDEQTWSNLSAEEKNMIYTPCVPSVIIQRKTDVDTMADLQTKVSRFIDAGTREGVIVDINGSRVWIYNQGEEPRFEPLAVIKFDSWPEFTLDCIEILEGRERDR